MTFCLFLSAHLSLYPLIYLIFDQLSLLISVLCIAVKHSLLNQHESIAPSFSPSHSHSLSLLLYFSDFLTLSICTYSSLSVSTSLLLHPFPSNSTSPPPPLPIPALLLFQPSSSVPVSPPPL